MKVRLWPAAEPRRWPAREREARGSGVVVTRPERPGSGRIGEPGTGPEIAGLVV